MISHEHRCIFVHIPKTAGNSINRVFGISWEDHKDLQRYADELPRTTFDDYFKFAIVRNPWDRLLSDYNYQVKKSRAPDSKLFVFTADGSKRDFAQWVETALAEPDRYAPGAWGGTVSAHIHRWSPQVDWISVDGHPRADFIARLERLPEDFHAIRRQLDLPPVRLPHRNRRLHWHYSHYYDRTTRELVAAYYARDIEFFGYEFERALLRLAMHWPGAQRTTQNDDPTPDEAPNGDGCTVSFATPRPRERPRIWRRHPMLALAASVALMFGLLGAASLAVGDAEAAPLTPVQQSVRRLIVRSANPPEDFLVRARRVMRTVQELHLSLELAPGVGPGVALMLASDNTETPRAVRAVAPAPTSSSGSSPAPRWWNWRNRNRERP